MERPRIFHLTVDDLTTSGRFALRLSDNYGSCLASHTVTIDSNNSLWRGLFETKEYLAVNRNRFSTEQQKSGEADGLLLEDLGCFLRTEVLGEQIARYLFSNCPCILLVEILRELPSKALELIHIPWELTRDEHGRTLPEADISVQILPFGVMPEQVPLDERLAGARGFNPDGPLRVLLAFAQSHGQVAMAMRHVHERLRRFFLYEVAPQFRIELDIAQYPVTRRNLAAAARQRGGYHIVHIFAHGRENLLIIEDEEGADDYVSGDELADCFTGGSLECPYLVFLGACYSGDIRVEPGMTGLWRALRRAQSTTWGTSGDRGNENLQEIEDILQPDYTGTALALLRAGVPQVLAMRYEVGEQFASDLAEMFYRHVLLERVPPALALGRFRVTAQQNQNEQGYRSLDWLSPVVLGSAEGMRPIRLARGRSDCANQLCVHGHLPYELRRAEMFVGRNDELRLLHRRLFSDEADRAVALLWGMGGLGKTALAAEVIHLWHTRFDFVLGSRSVALGEPLSLDAWLHELDYHVATSLGQTSYTVWDEQGNLPRDKWLEGRLDALIGLLNCNRMLLVIDNLDSNLRPQIRNERTTYLCADPEWSVTLTRLVRDLTPGTSCILLTSRHPPSELVGQNNVLRCSIGPLDPGEWCIFARTSPKLRQLILGDDDDRALLARALAVARGHPLILYLLELLAASRAKLARRLDEFEAQGNQYRGMGRLLTIHRSSVEREQEIAYFEDIVTHSVRTLIESLSPLAKRLLWIVTLALEDVHDRLIEAIWEDSNWGGNMPRLQPGGQDWQTPLRELLEAGLLTPKRRARTTEEGETEDCTVYVCHPIVAEQATEMIPAEKELPLNQYLRRYAEVHTSGFLKFRCPENRIQELMLIESSRLAVRYLLRLGDSETAVELVRRIHALCDASAFRRDVKKWIDDLSVGSLTDAQRNDLRVALAGVYMSEGRTRAAAALYREAVASSQQRKEWHNCGVASCNLGIALKQGSDYTASRTTFKASLRYYRKGGKNQARRIISLVELVRLSLIQGGQNTIDCARCRAARLTRSAQDYYERSKTGSEGDNEGVFIEGAELLLLVLELQREIEFAAQDWAAAKRICQQRIDLKIHHNKYDMVQDRGNRATCLMQLGHFDEAEQDFLYCLQAFQDRQIPQEEATALMQLAQIAIRKNDPSRARQFAARGLDVFYSMGMLAEVARAHRDIGAYSILQDRPTEATLDACRAALIALVVGQRAVVRDALLLLRDCAAQLPGPEFQKHWPTVEQVLNACPRLEELLAQKGITRAGAQKVLDQLWAAWANMDG